MKQGKPMNPTTRKAGAEATRGGSARLTPDVQRRIGSQLRAMYDDVVGQGVPDRFAQLLQQLDEQSDKGKK